MRSPWPHNSQLLLGSPAHFGMFWIILQYLPGKDPAQEMMDGDREHLIHKRQDLNCAFGLPTSVLLRNWCIGNLGLSMIPVAVASLITEAPVKGVGALALDVSACCTTGGTHTASTWHYVTGARRLYVPNPLSSLQFTELPIKNLHCQAQAFKLPGTG